ncbi:segregation/condensation protein A [Salipaludibacillus neizhouensis]|uniref:Segregation and condensation protein A n=1 Tax=Salipaludibacillus neizhouensis TaxID=885475 RepID=A0A3A9K822_9BACI|nr:segregation/condensation protein A [Salipaludibacillus neizhouensis]RKL67648.1 segregation/condensation protein A [Salipaludibacillus neizhouensis]
MIQYSVKLHAFEGPLDLLLHLIQKNDLDLYDIPVKEITEQYMTYIHAMQTLHLDVASEYLVMASTLLHMKSKLLLPVEEEVWDEDLVMEEEDTRDDLMQRLIEYKKYKEAAGELRTRETERSDLFSKPMTDLTPLLEDKEEGQSTPVNASIYDMLQAFQKMKKRNKKIKPTISTINRQEVPIDERMSQIVEALYLKKGRSRFSDLFKEDDQPHLVVTFLALLELMKANAIRCEQERNFEDIMVYAQGGPSIEES